MAIEQLTHEELTGSRLVLLVVLRQGARLDDRLIARIKRELGRRASAAHVPAAILAVDELPTPHSGKRSARIARNVLNATAIVNTAALRNPACLAQLRAQASAPENDRSQAHSLRSGTGRDDGLPGDDGACVRHSSTVQPGRGTLGTWMDDRSFVTSVQQVEDYVSWARFPA